MKCDGKVAWLSIFKDLVNHGKVVSPRNSKCIEIEDYTCIFDPIRDKFCSFEERGLSLKYLAGELAWYLNGDRNDERIEHYSSFWKTVKNQYRPLYNSNYGFYIFKEGQLQYVIGTLLKDRDSRQACIIINRPEVAMSSSTDKLCTNVIMFRIRDNKLNMTVQMRSNDVIYGLGIDCPMFCWLYEMIYQRLKLYYPELETGRYFHTSASFHIYERHFEMVGKIVNNEGANYQVHDFPTIKSYAEVDFLQKVYPNIEENVRTLGDRKVNVHRGYKFIHKLIEGLEGGGF